MVLGFGRGPERFPTAKEHTPGPGAYDPKDLETKLPPKSGFLTGERFSSQELEGNLVAEPSPPRERKPTTTGNDRSYSWATQRIHELTKELEAANKRVKEVEKLLKERNDRAEKGKKELAVAAEHRDELQKKLDEEGQELTLIRSELLVAKEQLSQVSAKEAKASRSAQAGAARVEQLLLELQQVHKQTADAYQQLEQQKSALQTDVEDERQRADAACAALDALQHQLDVGAAERAVLRERVASLDEQCRQQAAAVGEQTAKRAEAEGRAESVECSLTVTSNQLQQTLSELSELKAEAARNMECLLGDLAAARAESSDRAGQLGAAQAHLAAVQQQNEARLAKQMSEVLELRLNINNLSGELEAAKEGVQQRDESIVTFTARIDELVQQLGDQKAHLTAELQQRRLELEEAGSREQKLLAVNAQLEERLADSAVQCNQQAATATSLEEQLKAVREDLAVKVVNAGYTTAKLEAAQVVIEEQTQTITAWSLQISELKSEVAALSASAEQQVQFSAASTGKLQTLLSLKEAEAMQLGAQLASERTALEARHQDVRQLEHTLAERDLAVASLQSQTAGLRENVADRGAQLAAMASDMQQLSCVAKGLEESVAGLRTTLAERDAALCELSEELGDTSSALEARVARIVQLEVEAEAAAEHAAATGELVNTLEAHLSKVKGDASALKCRVSELEACNEKMLGELSVQRETCAVLSAELATNKSAVEDGAAHEVALLERVASMELRLVTAEEARLEMQQRRAQLESQLAAAHEAHSCLSRSHEELARGEAAMRLELEEKRELHEREGTALREQLAEVQGELATRLSALRAAQQEAEELGIRLQDAHVAAERRAVQLDQTQVDLASRSATVGELQCTVTDMERRLAAMETVKQQLEQLLSSTQQGLSSSIARCSLLEAQVAERDCSLAEAAEQRVRLQAALEELRAESQEVCARSKADAEKASARLAALEDELVESRSAAASMGADLAQLVTDLEGRGQEIKELKGARHEVSSALTAATAERAELRSQLEELQRRDMDLQAELATVCARSAQMEAEAKSLQALVTAAQDEAHLFRSDADAVYADLDKARDQIRVLQLQEVQTEGLRQELESMCVRLRDSETRNEVLQDKVVYMEGRVASMTPICSKAKLDDQVRALSDALEKSHLRSNELEDRARRNMLLETSAALELRRLTDENEHLVTRMLKLEDDLKEQSALGHNNHKQKIQYHLRLKQELEELRHECTVLLRDKFQLEQCIRYLAVQVGMGPDDRRQSLATAERKAIEKVLPACLTYNAIYTTPLSQRAMRMSARGKHNEQGTVYAGGKETFEEGIIEARTKVMNVTRNWNNDAQFAAAAMSPPVAERMDAVAADTGDDADTADGCTRPDTCGSPDGKAARGPAGNQPATAFGTPVATIRGAGTPGSTHGSAGAPQTLAKLEERIKHLISDVCAPATSRNPAGLPLGGAAATDMVGATPAATVSMHRGGMAGGARDRDQDKPGHGGASGSNGGASGSNGGASGSNGGSGDGNGGGGGSNGGGAGGNGVGRERPPRASIAMGGDAVASRAPGAQTRRQTTAAAGRMVFKS